MKFYVIWFVSGCRMMESFCDKWLAIKEANLLVLSGFNSVRVEDSEGDVIYEPFKK